MGIVTDSMGFIWDLYGIYMESIWNSTMKHMGLSENVGYIPNDSHLIGIMISKTIGYNGVHYFQTHPYSDIIMVK